MCAQSVPGLEFEIDPLKLCAAPVHTINLKTASRQLLHVTMTIVTIAATPTMNLLRVSRDFETLWTDNNTIWIFGTFTHQLVWKGLEAGSLRNSENQKFSNRALLSAQAQQMYPNQVFLARETVGTNSCTISKEYSHAAHATNSRQSRDLFVILCVILCENNKSRYSLTTTEIGPRVTYKSVRRRGLSTLTILGLFIYVEINKIDFGAKRSGYEV